MLNSVCRMVTLVAIVAAAGCTGRSEQRSDVSTAPSALPIAEATAASAGGKTLKEGLFGPAIGGVVPEGQAVADMSQFQAGGSTILTVQVKNVNLADGTVLTVTLSFTPVGSITLLRGEGRLTADLGHFGVSRDSVDVRNGSLTVLRGGTFQ